MRSGCSLCGGVKEGFHGTHQRFSNKQRIHMFFKQNALSSLLGLAIMIFCIYLSWTCNTKQGVEVIMKVIYAFFAAFFNIFYLIYYFLVRQQNC